MSDKVPTAREVLAAYMAAPESREAVGQRVGGDPADEAEHFYLCQACQQPVDMRDLAAVFHHEDLGHEPLPAEDAQRLIRISEQLRDALQAQTPQGLGSPASVTK
ncbi:hypothetical protein LJR219_004948 [Phenylobacterium sp. LjRoot219]|uniref:hypothetical protein n=1 Tax=Phenylobacterium sp. LjRoot219 TaxID=3342283 RepID=UPI003ECDFC7F